MAGLAAATVAGSLALSAAPAGASVNGSSLKILAHQAAPVLPMRSHVLGAETARLNLTVLLRPSDPAGLGALVGAVSDPSSPQYHRYLSPTQFAARFGASSSTLSALKAELRRRGATVGRVAADGLSLTVHAPASVAANIFHTSIRRARLASGRVVYANTSAATLPVGVSGVVGLDNLERAHNSLAVAPHTATSLPPKLCSAVGQRSFAYSPAQISTAYGTGAAYGAGLDGTGQTVALMELADYADNDIASYESCLGLSNESVQRVQVAPETLGTGTSEATFDIEQVLATAPGASVLVYEGDNSSQGIYDIYSRIINDNRAQIISDSWGLCEGDNDLALMRQENILFQQAAVQGQTMLAASGDSGSEDCYDSDQTTGLQVDDPASQPFVTGVGGTSLTSISPRSETAWNAGGGAGGGGISRVWPMPTYQQPAVGARSTGSPCGNSSGDCRQVPDVSASADPNHGYSEYCTAGDCGGAGWRSVGGTSLASPLWGAYVAMANQACATDNHRVGFINPALYSAAPGAVYDVTTGNNDLTGTNGGSYPAGTGYDMATGLGSPVVPGLLTVLCANSSLGGSTQGGSGSGTGTGTGTGGGTTGTGGGTGTTTPPVTGGYRFVAADGGIFTFGPDGFLGSAGAVHLPAPIVGMAQTPDSQGYWLVGRDGAVFTFGNARNFGSLAGTPLAAPIVGMAATADGLGYWLVGSDGGVFAFGDAAYHGSAGGLHLARPIVGMAADPVTGGYWLVAADGGIFSYGAPFFGSTGALVLAKPIVGMSATPGGKGYRFVASDGGIFDFGDAVFHGSTGAIHLAAPVVGMATTADGNGYWLVASDGGIFTFGDAPFAGSTGNIRLAAPIVGMAGA